MLIRPVDFNPRVGRLRSSEILTIRKLRELVDSSHPAWGWARWPDHPRSIFLCYHGHHKGRVYARRGVHHHLALVATIPDNDRSMVGQTSDLVPKLCVLCCSSLGGMAVLRVLHVVIDQES